MFSSYDCRLAIILPDAALPEIVRQVRDSVLADFAATLERHLGAPPSPYFDVEAAACYLNCRTQRI